MTATEPHSHTAYDRIRQAIVEGRYKPGQRLIEQRIAEEFDLSRTPVREALRRLDAEGLVRSEPNRGAVVREVTIDDLIDLYELRARLESYAAELAAERIAPGELAEIDAGIADFASALANRRASALETTRAVNAANRRIHQAILGAAGHERLARLLDRTVDVPLVFQAFRQFDRAQTERSNLFHGLIREAIADGDGPRAGALMREHVLQGRDVLLAHLSTSTDGASALFAG